MLFLLPLSKGGDITKRHKVSSKPYKDYHVNIYREHLKINVFTAIKISTLSLACRFLLIVVFSMPYNAK